MRVVAAYFAERFPPAVFGPALILMVGGAAWVTGTLAMPSLVRAFALASLLLAHFRLWDDLEDAARDRVTHPDRVLVRAPAAMFRAICVALLVAALVLCLDRPGALAVVMGVDAAFLWAYRVLRRHVSEQTWHFGILLKYPAFLIALSLSMGSPDPGRLTVSAVAAYLCASGYEMWHTRRANLGVSS